MLLMTTQAVPLVANVAAASEGAERASGAAEGNEIATAEIETAVSPGCPEVGGSRAPRGGELRSALAGRTLASPVARRW